MKRFLELQMEPFIKSIKKPTDTWNYEPPTKSDRLKPYVGLQNFGSTCYMNSMMQQFFMIPCFRNNLLSVDDGVEPDMVEHKNEWVDDNLLHQLQNMFTHLEFTERPVYKPVGFCYAFKEDDGAPMKTWI